ncbi:hypothetical protein IG631_23188 [Alternaria alternata]|nr:hypothetical protein IG631_23188 [Alternaria alternata]
MSVQEVGEGVAVDEVVVVVVVEMMEVNPGIGSVSILSCVRTQYDWKSQGLQSRPTKGFHLWNSSGLMPNILRVSSHDTSQPLSYHSTQSLAVSESHWRSGRRAETTRRTSSARTMKAVSFIIDGIATMQGDATDSRDRERGLCSTTVRSSAGEKRSSICFQ